MLFFRALLHLRKNLKNIHQPLSFRDIMNRDTKYRHIGGWYAAQAGTQPLWATGLPFPFLAPARNPDESNRKPPCLLR